MSNFKRILVVLMVLVLALSLAACGGGKEEKASGTVWVPTYNTVGSNGVEFEYINSSVYDPTNEKIYMLSYGKVGMETGYDEAGNYYEYEKYGNMILSCNADGSGLAVLGGYDEYEIPEGYYGGSSIYNMYIDPNGGIWLLENIYMYPDTEDGWNDSVDKYYLLQLNAQGEVVQRMDLSNIEPEADYFYVNDYICDASGNLYVTYETNVAVLDAATGELKFKLPATDGWLNGIFQLADGSVAANLYLNEGGGEIRKIDVDKKAWGASNALSKDMYNTFAGIRDYDLCFHDSNGIFGYKIADGTTDLLVNWLDADIAYGGLNPFTLDDDTFMMINEAYDSSGKSKLEIIQLNEVDASTVTPKTEITLAAYYLDYQLRNSIIDFNKTNSDYRIKVVDYSVYNNYNSSEEADWNAGLTKLNTELIAGNIPDMLAASSLPIDIYGSRGILEDLYPWIDKTIGRDNVVEAAFDSVASENGKLYFIFDKFELMTMVGDKNKLAAYKPWTMENMIKMAEDHPESDLFSYYYTRDTFISTMLMYCSNQFIDWESGKCSFDSPEFIKMLEFSKTFPETYNWEDYEDNYESETTRIKNGKQLLQEQYLGDFDSYLRTKIIFEGNADFVGYPSEEGGGAKMQYYNGLAMSATSKHKDVVWEFISMLLSEDYQDSSDGYYWSFPTNKAVLDKMAARAMERDYYIDEDGNKVYYENGYFYIDGVEVEDRPLTQEEVNEVFAIIDTIDGSYFYQQDLYNIIQEELAFFYNGQKTAAETAAMIQSRAFVYVNEQR